MALEGTVKTPFGEMKKQTALTVGLGGVAIMGVVWYRSKNAAASAAATPATTTDPNAATSGIDPNTGLLYSQEDNSSSIGGQVIGYDTNGDPIYGAGSGGGGGGSLGGGINQPGSFTNNAQWSQYAENYLVNTEGMDAVTVGNALGKYITGQPLTADMVQVVQSAISIANQPPVPGANGNPPGYNQTPTGPTGSGNASNPVRGLHTTAVDFTNFTVAWNASAHAKSYNVTVMDGAKTVSKQTVSVTSARVGGLRQKTSYVVRVWASPSPGGATASIHVRTK